MSTKKKLLKRLFSRPKDFTWDEMETLLNGLDYVTISGEGSRYKFSHTESGSLINLHKPHPGNIVKSYAIDDVIESLKARGIQP
ncbi:MAG: type II toxin-antitoxin system HicA family toxin [Syntrophobacteraceae bacterium]